MSNKKSTAIKKTRDDFSALIKNKLRERAAYRCSNPDCRAPTIAPKAGTNDKSIILGQAAHICAASKGGPRYLTVMTPSERSAIKNAIWLCCNCARKIDVDEKKYSISLLQKWKQSAEDKAAEEIGKRPLCYNDVRDQAFSMMGGFPPSLRLQSVSNVHAAFNKIFEAADPRFTVQTGYDNGLTTICLDAQENVNLSLNFNPSAAPEWNAAMIALIEHGHDVRLPKRGVIVEGSPLFDLLMLNQIDGTIKIEAPRKNAIVKFNLVSPCGNRNESFDDVHGHVTAGKKTFTFEGKSCGGVFEIKLYAPLAKLQSDGDFDILCNFHPWLGNDIRKIPYLQKIKSIFEYMENGWLVEFVLEIDGNRMANGRSKAKPNLNEFSKVIYAINYIERAGEIAKFLKASIVFDLGHEISEAEYTYVYQVSKIIKGSFSYISSDLQSNPSFLIFADETCSNIKQLFASQGCTSRATYCLRSEDVLLFGKNIPLPNIKIILHDVKPKIDLEINQLSPGDEVLVEWIPGPDFMCTYAFI